MLTTGSDFTGAILVFVLLEKAMLENKMVKIRHDFEINFERFMPAADVIFLHQFGVRVVMRIVVFPSENVNESLAQRGFCESRSQLVKVFLISFI